MDVFGLTPIDTALSIWGLNCAQNLTNFIFVQTHIGALVFAVGFILSLWKSTREANLKYLATFLLICLAVFFLIIISKKNNPSFKSASEVYGDGTFSSQSLINSQINTNEIPVSLSFLGQMADSIAIGSIAVLDSFLSEDLRFLNNPLVVSISSLKANQFLFTPIPNIGLNQDLSDFIYADYIPSLYMYLNDYSQTSNVLSLWPGDSRIFNYYSSQSQSQWSNLQVRLSQLIDDPQGPWVQTKSILSHFNNNNSIDDQIMASFIRGQMHVQNQPWWCGWVAAMQSFFSYSYGAANFLLYVSFPFLIVIIIIFRHLHVFLHYMEVFIWVKSWILTAALSHYISLILIQVQSQTNNSLNWYWEYPYHALLSSVFLYLLPLMSFIGLNKGFQLIHNLRRGK